ncbi:zinc finger Y-chromosomal protein 2-like [Apis dorsata]|uniref:zinc finger Y-chromosomal protein 2-like n=1 Tax=Apis dorsata TaxID=7462 RepID=UPI00129331A7|nr:zinc finger Y-chromosomal protein 2-like [Apis dorsata]
MDIGNRHTCEWCGRPFSWPSSLRLHQRMACGKPPNFCCTICDYKSNFKGNLKRHLFCKHRIQICTLIPDREAKATRLPTLRTNVFLGVESAETSEDGLWDDSVYRCKVKEETMEICLNLEERGVEERLVENRFEEIREDEEGEEGGEMEKLEYRGGKKKRRQEYKYSCLRCLKSYKRKGHLVEHQKIFCGKDKQQCCPYCVFRTYKKSNLKKHVNRKHCDVIDYVNNQSSECCEVRELILWEDYQRFEAAAIGETRQFRSGRCSSSYEANYFGPGRKHGRVFRNKSMDPLGDRYKCSKCSKSYRWKHHLMEHVKASCGQKKAECCPYCSYRSNRKWNLKSHMKRIHADV